MAKKNVSPDEPKVVTSEEVVEEVVEQKKAKTDHYSLYAWFAYKDQEGFKVKAEFKGEGTTVGELLNSFDFPKGTNTLVNVTIKHGDVECQKALAPHMARAILEYKDEFKFNVVFRGI